MPFIRIQITCGLCGAQSPITVGNPDLATQAKDSPLIRDPRGAIFECAHCKAKIRIPLRPEEDHET